MVLFAVVIFLNVFEFLSRFFSVNRAQNEAPFEISLLNKNDTSKIYYIDLTGLLVLNLFLSYSVLIIADLLLLKAYTKMFFLGWLKIVKFDRPFFLPYL